MADGHGLLYVLTINEDGAPSTLVSVHQLPSSRPFQIHSAQHTDESSCVLVLSFLHAREADQPKDSPQVYEICAAKLHLPIATLDVDIPQLLGIIWQRKGSDVPTRVLSCNSTRLFLLLGGSPYVPDKEMQVEGYEPTAEEIAPIPRAGENLDLFEAIRPPPPFSWTQNSDSLTIAIPLPSSTPKNAIKVTIGKQALSLQIAQQPDSTNVTPIPSYHQKRFWGVLDPDSSIWTWEREAEHSHGLLTLHLEKANDHVRWPHVFEPSPSSDSVDDVPEAVDPSELAGIRESLEKYTASLASTDEAGRPGLGLGQGASSLSQGELDDEIDSSVGRQLYQTWIPWDEAGKVPHSTTPLTLLSSPLPGYNATTPSVITKNNLDGNLFVVKGSDSNFSWKHTASFSALAFVLASKQDSRFVYHTEDTVLTFESGVRDGTGNLFIYRTTARPKDLWAKQSVLNVAGGSPLLGVGTVCDLNSGKFVACLTERELVIVRGVI